MKSLWTLLFIGFSWALHSQTYTSVDQMPILTMCKDSVSPSACTKTEFLKGLYSEIRYPALARENNIQGRTALYYTVDTTGKISDYKIGLGIGAGIDNEVLRVIKSLRQNLKYEPAIKDGKAVNFEAVVPVNFKLEGKPTGRLIVIKHLNNEQSDIINLASSDITVELDGTLTSLKNLVKRNLDECYITHKNENKEGTFFKILSREKAEEEGLLPYKYPDIRARFISCDEDGLDEKELSRCSTSAMYRDIFSQLRNLNFYQRAEGGFVIIEFVVDKEGFVKDERIVQDLSTRVGKTYLKLIKSWNKKGPKFYPGLVNDKPVDSIMRMHFKTGTSLSKKEHSRLGF